MFLLFVLLYSRRVSSHSGETLRELQLDPGTLVVGQHSPIECFLSRDTADEKDCKPSQCLLPSESLVVTVRKHSYETMVEDQETSSSVEGHAMEFQQSLICSFATT